MYYLRLFQRTAYPVSHTKCQCQALFQQMFGISSSFSYQLAFQTKIEGTVSKTVKGCYGMMMLVLQTLFATFCVKPIPMMK